jgi:hypothetical protein
MPGTIEEKLKAAMVSAPAGNVASYPAQTQNAAGMNTVKAAPANGTEVLKGNNLDAVSQYLAPGANVEGVLTDAKNQREQAAAANRDALLGSIGKTYGMGVQNVNTAADEAQRQNYISQQMQQRNIGQQLAAAGLTGGAAESTMLGMANSYGENRRQTEADRLQRVSELEGQRAQQEAGAQVDYNNLMATIAGDYAAQLSAARQAETDRQAQLLMQKFAADQQAAQAAEDRKFQQQMTEYDWQQQQAAAEANRLWQGQQAEADRAHQLGLTEYEWQQKLAQAEADRIFQQQQAELDRQHQMGMTEYDWQQQMAAAEANRLWQQQQAELDRQHQMGMTEYDWQQKLAQAEADRAYDRWATEYGWQQQFAMADKELAAQLQLAAAKGAGSSGGSGGGSGGGGTGSTYVPQTNAYKNLGVSDAKAAGYAADMDKVYTGVIDKQFIKANWAAFEAEYGRTATQKMYDSATGGATAEQQATQDLIANALAAQNKEQAVQNAGGTTAGKKTTQTGKSTGGKKNTTNVMY